MADRRVDDLPTLYAEETDVLHPFDPERAPALRTRAELREHFVAGAARRKHLRFRPEDITIHETTDPEVIVAEFAYRGAVLATGEEFSLPAIFVMRVREGEIVWSRDYFDYTTAARVFGSET